MRGQKRKEPPGFDALIEAERRAREGTGFSTELVDLRLAVFRKLDKRAKRAEDERQQIARAESDAASARALADARAREAEKEAARRAAAAALTQVKKERDEHESRGELLDSMVTPLESQRRQLQELVSAAAEALMERGVPTRMLADDAVPFYYAQHSWEAEQEVPWNVEAKRPMSLAEGIAWVHDNPKPPHYPGRRRL